jgi:hypothetical protein
MAKSKVHKLNLDDPCYNQVYDGEDAHDYGFYADQINVMKAGDIVVFSHSINPLTGSFERKVIEFNQVHDPLTIDKYSDTDFGEQLYVRYNQVEKDGKDGNIVANVTIIKLKRL